MIRSLKKLSKGSEHFYALYKIREKEALEEKVTFPPTFSYSVATSEASRYPAFNSADFAMSHVASCWQSITPWFCFVELFRLGRTFRDHLGKFLLHKDHLNKDQGPCPGSLFTFLTSPHFPTSIAVTQVRKRTQRS